ncbi:MAG: hypothetical protein NTW49_11160 [Bacteroidia bacterium]|nr:hypothetical protein [Bacteroidia bacterium]
MRNLKFIAGLFALLLTSRLVAQSVEMEWGPYIDLPKKTQFVKVAGFDKNFFFAYRAEKTKDIHASQVWLDKFSSGTMQMESSVEIKPPKIYTKDAVFEDIFYLNGKLILFSTVIDNGKNRKTLYAQQIDESGATTGTPKMIGDIAYTAGDANVFNFSLTSDKSKIVIEYNMMFNVYGNEPFYFRVLDSDLNLSFSKDLTLPLVGKSFDIEQYEVGGSGNVYLALKVEPASKKKTSKKPASGNTRAAGPKTARMKYDWSLYVYNAKKEIFQPYTVEVEKFKAADMTFALDKDENIVIFGFYTKKSTDEFSGMFCRKIDPRIEKVITTTTKDFSKDRKFIAQFRLERNGTNNEEIFNYDLGKIEFLDDGSCVFLTEQTFGTNRTMVDPKTKAETVIHYYNYNDIIAASVSSDNKMEWITRIPKCQFSTNDEGYYSSFVTANYANKVKIMFNDAPKNLKNTAPEKTKQIKNNVASNPEGAAMVVTLFPDGNTDKALLFGPDEEKTSMCPKFFFNTGSSYIIYGEKGNMPFPLPQKYKWGNFFFE